MTSKQIELPGGCVMSQAGIPRKSGPSRSLDVGAACATHACSGSRVGIEKAALSPPGKRKRCRAVGAISEALWVDAGVLVGRGVCDEHVGR